MRRPKSDEPLTGDAARLKALRLLGRREHSSRELKGKLRQGGVAADEAEQLVESLGGEGWQSDPRFAASRVQNRIAQGYGPLRIRAELQMAGLPQEMIREALEEADCDWTALCIASAQRRFRGPATDRAERQRRYNHLAARGFEGEQIRAALESGDDAG